MISRDRYVGLIKDLLSKDAERIKVANRELYAVAVGQPDQGNTESDLALAEAGAVND